MNVKEVKSVLQYLFQAKVTPMLIGHHSEGKSAGVKQYAQEKGFKFFDLRAGTQESGDLIGLANFKKENGIEVATEFLMPEWLRDLILYCKESPKSGAVIFVDEINRARPDVIQALFQLVLDYKLHTTLLPENCYVVGAMNPPTEDYNVTIMSDKAWDSRFCFIKVSISVDEWLEYARNNNFSKNTINYIAQNPESLKDASLIPFNLDNIRPSTRGWEAVSKLELLNVPMNLFQELIFGLVGVAEGIKYIDHLNNGEKPLSGEDIVSSYEEHRERILDIVSSLGENGRSDIVNASSQNLASYLSKKEGDLTEKEISNVRRFLLDIPVDYSFSVCRDIYMVDGGEAIVDCPEITEIIKYEREISGVDSENKEESNEEEIA